MLDTFMGSSMGLQGIGRCCNPRQGCDNDEHLDRSEAVNVDIWGRGGGTVTMSKYFPPHRRHHHRRQEESQPII